jgi:hypothetical protein
MNSGLLIFPENGAILPDTRFGVKDHVQRPEFRAIFQNSRFFLTVAVQKSRLTDRFAKGKWLEAAAGLC